MILGTVTELSCGEGAVTCTPGTEVVEDPLTGQTVEVENVLAISGAQLAFNHDQRIRSGPITNRGFAVDLMATDPGSLVGAFASGEGYYGNDDKLYYYFADVDGGALVDPDTPKVSAERMQARQHDDGCEYRGRGFTYHPVDPTQEDVTVSILPPAAEGGSPQGVLFDATPLPDAELPTDPTDFGIWDVDIDINVGALGGDCLEVVYLNFPGAKAVRVEVETR